MAGSIDRAADSAGLSSEAMPSGNGTNRVFICYRRGDTGGYAEAIYQALRKRLGKGRVFLDQNSIPTADDFVRALEREVVRADTVLVVVGEQWSSPENLQRLQDENDFVRREIRSALTNDARVIPVFVGRATLPPEQDLPSDIRRLARIQGLPLTGLSDVHVRNLLRVVVQGRIGVLAMSLTLGTGALVASLLNVGFSEIASADLPRWIYAPVRTFLNNFPLLLSAAFVLAPYVTWSVQRLLLAAFAAGIGAALCELLLTLVPNFDLPSWVRIVTFGGVSTALSYGSMALCAAVTLRPELNDEKFDGRQIARLVASIMLFSYVCSVAQRFAYRAPQDWLAVLLPDSALFFLGIACGALFGLRHALDLTLRDIVRVAASVAAAGYVVDVTFDLVTMYYYYGRIDDALYVLRRTTLYTLGGCALGLSLGALDARRKRVQPV